MYGRMREETMSAASNPDSLGPVADNEQRALAQSENRPQWVEVDAGGSVEYVAKEIWSHVEPFVRLGGISRPIGRLWMDRLPSAGVSL